MPWVYLHPGHCNILNIEKYWEYCYNYFRRNYIHTREGGRCRLALYETMICKKCGKPVEDDMLFCTNCGADLQQAPEVDFALNTQVSEPAKKKNKKLLAILIPVIAVVVAAAVALALFLPGLLAAKQDPQIVLHNAFNGAGAAASSEIIQYLTAYEQAAVEPYNAVSGTLELEISKTLLELLGAGSGEDMSWLNNISIGYLTAIEANKMQLDMSLSLAQTYILGMEMAYDMGNGKAWMGFPDLHDELLFVPLDPNRIDALATPPYEQMLKILVEDKETVSLLVEKGINAICSSIQAERIEEETVTIGDNEYTVKAVYCYVDNQTSLEPQKEFLTWLSDYDAFYDLLDQLDDLFSEYYGYENLYLADSTRNGIEAALDQLAEGVRIGEPVEFCVYLDDSGKVVGMSGIEGGVSAFEIIAITEGGRTFGRFAADTVGIFFDLTENNGITNGEISLKMADNMNLTLLVEDLRVDNESIGGVVTLELPKELVSNLMGNMGFAPQVELRMTMDSNGKTFEVKLELVMADMTMLTLTSTGKAMYAYFVSFPEGGVDITDPEALEAWTMGLDYEQILTNILEAGVPESVVMAMLYGVAGQ